MKAGVPQGSVLGPTLCTTNMPILENHNLPVVTYADGFAILSSAYSASEAAETAQAQLDY